MAIPPSYKPRGTEVDSQLVRKRERDRSAAALGHEFSVVDVPGVFGELAVHGVGCCGKSPT
jgi:hypothetical protein